MPALRQRLHDLPRPGAKPFLLVTPLQRWQRIIRRPGNSLENQRVVQIEGNPHGPIWKKLNFAPANRHSSDGRAGTNPCRHNNIPMAKHTKAAAPNPITCPTPNTTVSENKPKKPSTGCTPTPPPKYWTNISPMPAANSSQQTPAATNKMRLISFIRYVVCIVKLAYNRRIGKQETVR